MTLKIGDIAPDFELLNQDEKSVKLSDYRGKRVILFAYPKASTPGCTTQACGFRDQFPKIEKSNAVVLGISPDEPKDQKKWQEREKLPYDLLCDTDQKVLEAYGVWGEKSMFGKKYMGVTRSHWVIDENGVLVDVQVGVSPKDSVERAIATLG
ncbi:MAG: thioredoxin-dependent thiol peroxidase [Phototrophicales bacterium]|nr:thioredoxin-dependent thiol peroxidase [Phototrophicales bacterium]